MYRAILPEGQIECERYDHAENGVELYDGDEAFVAFVPYDNLHALVDEEFYGESDRSVM
jgi:hypothetical protein